MLSQGAEAMGTGTAWILLMWGVVIGTSLMAAISDVRTFRIPNALTLPLALSGLVWSYFIHGPPGLLGAVGASALLAGPFVLMFLVAGGGAGDAKLMGAIGFWVGLDRALILLVATLLWGGMLGIAFAVRQRRLRAVLGNVTAVSLSVMTRVMGMPAEGSLKDLAVGAQSATTMPYGIAILAGVLSAAVAELLK